MTSGEKLISDLIFTDPETNEWLKLFMYPQKIKADECRIYVQNKDGTRKWKYTIKAEKLP